MSTAAWVRSGMGEILGPLRSLSSDRMREESYAIIVTVCT